MSDAQKGKKHPNRRSYSPESLEHIRQAAHKRKGTHNKQYVKSPKYKHNDTVFPKGIIPWNKGKNGVYSEGTRKRISETLKAKKYCPTDEMRAKALSVNLGRIKSEEEKAKLSKALMGHINSKQTRLKMSISHTGVPLSNNQRQTMSITWKNKYQDMEFKNNRIRQIMRGCTARPTIPELRLDDILQKHFPNSYKYTGNREFVIGGKNPDFVNINGQKKLIEMYGDY